MLKEAAVNQYANVIFDTDRERAATTVHAFLGEIGVHYCGRYGNWDHAWTDEAFLSGEKAAHMALDALGKHPRLGAIQELNELSEC